MTYKIIKRKELLKQPSLPVSSIEEGQRIGEHLKHTLKKVGGVGLSAPQIGIHKRVCLVQARKNAEPLVLINPRVTASDPDKILYFEGCLSLPKGNWTARNKTVTIMADNLDKEILFKPEQELTAEQYRSGEHLNGIAQDEGLLEAVAVQHELDHLDGILITDPSVKVILEPPVRNKVKHGRNEKVMIRDPKTQESQRVKFKKIREWLDKGWELI